MLSGFFIALMIYTLTKLIQIRARWTKNSGKHIGVSCHLKCDFHDRFNIKNVYCLIWHLSILVKRFDAVSPQRTSARVVWSTYLTLQLKYRIKHTPEHVL